MLHFLNSTTAKRRQYPSSHNCVRQMIFSRISWLSFIVYRLSKNCAKLFLSELNFHRIW